MLGVSAMIALLMFAHERATRRKSAHSTARAPLATRLAFVAMGAAFLLLETKSIVQFSLLFGTTWVNTSLVFVAVLVMVLAATAMGLLIGVVLERGVLRLVYGKDEVIVVLVTYAVFLILEDVIILVWGPGTYAAYQPLAVAGSIAIGNLVLSGYDIGLVAFAAVLAAFASWALKRTRYGRLLTVVIFDRETAAAFGVNVKLVYTVTFLVGAVLGAIGGAVMAPKIAVTLGIGVEVIVLAFAVVATGGMGSIEGALIGALIVGLCRAAAVHLLPQLELFVIYAVMALVLVFRPYGLIARAQPRRI